MTRRARSNRLSGCWVGTGLMPIGGAADLTHNSQQRSSGPHSKQAVLPIPLRSGPKISFPLWLAQTPSQPKLRHNDHSSSQKKKLKIVILPGFYSAPLWSASNRINRPANGCIWSYTKPTKPNTRLQANSFASPTKPGMGLEDL